MIKKECVLDVPQLTFNKTARKFTPKRSAQSSTLSSLDQEIRAKEK